MPTYIKSFNEISMTAQDWTSPEGASVPKDQMWEHIKEKLVKEKYKEKKKIKKETRKEKERKKK